MQREPETTHPSDEEMRELFGSPARAIEVDEDELEIVLLCKHVRHELFERAMQLGVGVNDLARKLNVSPAVVSRFFSNEGDMRLSTAVLFARALDCEWTFTLKEQR